MPPIEVRQNLFDRLIGAVSPERGLSRLAARARLDAATGGYNGGRRDRRSLKRWRPGEGSADADTLQDLPDMRGRSRDLERNAPIAAGAIITKTTGVVGEGLQLKASINTDVLGISAEQAAVYEREQQREWEVFCKNCDFTRVQCFDELQQLTIRAALQSGDVFGVRRYRQDPGDIYGTKIQLLEADRVSNPNWAADSSWSEGASGFVNGIAGGVETDKDGVHVAYHVTNQHPGNLRRANLKWERVPARTNDGRQTVLHIFERLRPEMTRGIPYLATVIEHVKQLSTYSSAEVDAAVVSSFVTGIVETPNDDDDREPIIGEKDSQLNANEVKLGPAAVISLAPGEKFSSFNPARPNEKFDPFVKAFCREIGVALELPLELLLKQFTASYSASRAALEMAWQAFRKTRSWFAGRFCQPIYEWMMEEAVASGRLNRPGFFSDPLVRAAYCGAEWIGPQRASLNPYQEAQADALDIETGVKTREQVCMERTGGEIEKKSEQLVKEQAMREPLKPAPLAPAAGNPAAPANTAAAQDDAGDDDTEDKETDDTNRSAGR